MDTLATTIFQIRAACIPGGIGEGAVVTQVKKELGSTNAAINLVKPWAKQCINSNLYTSSALMKLKLHLGEELFQAYLLANSPVEFSLDALIGGVLDPGTRVDEDALLALRVDVNFSSVRINAYSKIPTYILVATSDSSFVAEHLNQSWESLLMLYPDGRKVVSIPKEIAGSWEILAVAAMKNLQVIGKSEAFKQWGRKEQGLFGYLVRTIWGHDMTSIVAKSLGRHPMAVFGDK